MMNGIIIVEKEKGFTSHDVVAKMRGILHRKKIGHTGTLDPDAVGVLPVCVGKATKVCAMLTDMEKTYVAQVRLGVTTDTLDMTGNILSQKKVTVSGEELYRTLEHFHGEIQQIPPMYSAVKVQGKRLYELARQGKEVQRKPRTIVIHNLLLREEALDRQEFTIEVKCSKGTYIRTLCQDIGEELGCGSAMKSLVRTQVGPFTIAQAKTLDEIQTLIGEKREEEILIPIERIFDNYRSGEVGEEAMKYLRNGNRINASLCTLENPLPDEYIRMYGADGQFYAIYRFDSQENRYHIVKMFHE